MDDILHHLFDSPVNPNKRSGSNPGLISWRDFWMSGEPATVVGPLRQVGFFVLPLNHFNQKGIIRSRFVAFLQSHGAHFAANCQDFAHSEGVLVKTRLGRILAFFLFLVFFLFEMGLRGSGVYGDW